MSERKTRTSRPRRRIARCEEERERTEQLEEGYSRPAIDGSGLLRARKHLPTLGIEFQEHAIVEIDGALRVAFG